MVFTGKSVNFNLPLLVYTYFFVDLNLQQWVAPSFVVVSLQLKKHHEIDSIWLLSLNIAASESRIGS